MAYFFGQALAYCVPGVIMILINRTKPNRKTLFYLAIIISVALSILVRFNETGISAETAGAAIVHATIVTTFCLLILTLTYFMFGRGKNA